MARKEARIYVEVWEHDRFKALSFGAQWLYWALLSQADLSFCGVLSPATPWWATLAKDASQQKVERWLAELHAADFILHDAPAAQVLITGLVRRDGVLNSANLIVAMSRAYAEVRSAAIRNRILDELREEYPKGVLDAITTKYDIPNEDPKKQTKPIADRMDQRLVNDLTNPLPNPPPKGVADLVHGTSTEVTEVTEIADGITGGDDSRVPLLGAPKSVSSSPPIHNEAGHISTSLSALGGQR